MKSAAVLCAWALSCTAVQAVAAPVVYRCGPDGREYSQTPCKNGRVVDAADARSADQVDDGRDAARRDARLARELARERREREREGARRVAAGFKPEAAASAASAASTATGKKGKQRRDHDAAPAAPVRYLGR
jgi:hypothetical protein